MSQRGFTLLEVLVALVITGLTVTVFLQLLSSGLLLESKGRMRTEAAMVARQTFDRLLGLDMRGEDYPWTGETENGGYAWTVNLKALEVQRARDSLADGEIFLRLPAELYEVTFDFRRDGKPLLRLARVVSHPATHFSADFKNEFADLPEGMEAFPEPGSAPGSPNTPASGDGDGDENSSLEAPGKRWNFIDTYDEEDD